MRKEVAALHENRPHDCGQSCWGYFCLGNFWPLGKGADEVRFQGKIERTAPTEEDTDEVREGSHHIEKFLEGLGNNRFQLFFRFEQLFGADC